MNVVEAANAEYSAIGMNIPSEVKTFMRACRTAFVKGSNWRMNEVVKTLRKLKEKYEDDIKNAKGEQESVYASGMRDSLIILLTLIDN